MLYPRHAPPGRLRLTGWWVAMCGLLLASVSLVLCAERRPNVLLIITDQLQAEALSVFRGDRDLRTPHLDRLVKGGVVFTRAFAANPRCVPSRSSIFTGYFPHQLGVQENEPADPKSFTAPLLGRYFTDAGYETAYFGKFHIPVVEGEQHGFGHMAHLRSVGQDEVATEDAVGFLNAVRRPFLLAVSYCNPHNICEYGRNETLPDGPVPAPPSLAACPPAVPNPDLPRDECDTMVEQKSLRLTQPDYRLLERYTADDWRRYRWAYYRMIEKVDAQIGRVLSALERSGHRNDTLIVFTSDHGEAAGAHGFSEKVVFYEESARVPLVLSWPSELRASSHTQLVNTGIDLVPTLLDFAGISPPASLPGRSLRPVASGRAPADWREYVVAENMMQAGSTQVNGRMVGTAHFKYCVFDRGARNESLFDELNDPLEQTNLAYDPRHAADVARARALLREHAERYNDPAAQVCLQAIARR
jgi:arylsulfatase A-like enzyme